MRYFIFAFSIVVTIAACSDTTSENGFHSRQIGNWYLKTQHTAQYNPNSTTPAQKNITASATDTVNITSPEQINVALTTAEDSTSGIFTVSFMDSSLTFSDYLDRGFVGTLDIQSADSNTVNIYSTYYAGTGTENILQAYFLGKYNCDGSSFAGTFHYNVYENDDTTSVPVKVYTLDARGFQQTLDILSGCSN